MEYYARQPLEVFAIDKDMNRLTGSIPYTSLIWTRRYNEPGEFSMVVLADVYSTDWAYIYCADRPETGIVQKVEYDDTEHTPNGRDNVVVSGFFLERVLHDYVFLVEETAEKEYEVPRPRNPNTFTSDMKSTYEVGYSTVAGKYVYKDKTTGEWTDSDGQTVAFGGVESVELDWNGKKGSIIERPDGIKVQGYTKDAFGYWTEDGGQTVKGSPFAIAGGTPDAESPKVKDYDVLVKITDTTYVINRGSDEKPRPYLVRGVGGKQGSSYLLALKKWENGPKTVTVKVQGPWQRTPIGEPEKKDDSVKLVTEWVQYFFTDELAYPETDVTGTEKVLDLTMKHLDEVVYDNLNEVGASCRVQYDFELDKCYFEVYKGRDLTQGSPEVEADRLPDGYTALEYAESSGSQWVDTGVTLTSASRVVIDYQLTGIPATSAEWYGVFGARDYQPSYQNAFAAWISGDGYYRFDYMDGSQGGGHYETVDTLRHTLTVDGPVVYMDGTAVVTNESATFTCNYPCVVFAARSGETPNEQWFYSKMRVYSFEVYEDGEQVAGFVPCKDPSGSVGLYDTVGMRFVGSSGGVLAAGPEIEKEEAANVGPWVTFNDTWGTMFDYSASVDDSNYANTMYVLYDYEEPDSFDDEGYPKIQPIIGFDDENYLVTEGWYIPYHTNQGYYTVTVGSDDESIREEFLDMRDSDPSCDSDWPRDETRYDDPIRGPHIPSPEDAGLTKCKGIYDSFPGSLQSSGRTALVKDHGRVVNLDTGTVNTDGYIRDYDLGDKVDWSVYALGVQQEARITEVTEVYESGSIQIQLSIGDQLVTLTRKARR